MSQQTDRFNDPFRDKIATVDERGKRVWVFPKKQYGRFFTLRGFTAYMLLILLFSGPWIKIGDEPLLMINVIERKFVFFGQVFWPEDIFLFAVGMVAFIVFVIFFTVVFGRLFCGWICPQTIFMEMVFRRIEYLVDGDWQQQKQLDKMPWNAKKISKRLLKWSIFWLISFAIANTFLAYIIGSDELKKIIIDDPSNHVGGLVAILIFTSVFFSVFAWFREQVCVAVCPYGRLQGVLLDKNSIVVSYDYVRGENRSKIHKNEDRAKAGKGDCIDCHQCVNVCPTGIDIRNGTQLECINCTLCIDACNHMMDAVNLKRGLIRLASEEGIRTRQKFRLTTRAKAYVVLMIAIVGLLATLIITRSEINVTILRLRGTSYQKIDENTYSNIFETTLINKTNEKRLITMQVNSGNAIAEMVGGPLAMEPGTQKKRELVIRMDRSEITGPKTPLVIGIYANGKLVTEEEINFSGPGF